MPRISAFEEHTEAYDAWFERHRDLYEAELCAVRALLPPRGAEILEVGVGSGRFAVPLGIRVGVEPSGRMADRARSLGIEVHEGVAEALPFHDGCFDAVLLVTTICFVDDVAAALQEARRVLKPGGRLVVGFVDRDSELGRRYEENRERSRFYREATFFSPAELVTLLEAAGFCIGRIVQALLPAKPPEILREGHGEGAFVAIQALAPGHGSTSDGPLDPPGAPGREDRA
ncbi:MAG: class I SAM-dependent methyltransferase [Deltaproteobacteria bacterium]|nr:class I SAM-dependent methyltransferase [Deltaproteobacteria bacterium]